ncbi:MAG: ABC transporter permease [Bacteroidetes bacterium]|nr:ABC transporter permease [Bacteroidota bacterium]
MFGNYLKSALRSLRKQLGYTAINLFGLALGLAVSLLIFLFVQHELSFDTYHPESKNTYRVVLDARFNGSAMLAPIAPAPMAKALLADYPEVENTARVFGFGGELMIKRGDAAFLDRQIMMADSSLFDMFQFEFLRGDAQTALSKPRTIVLTKSLADKLFGTTDPLGEIVILGDTTQIEVTGVIADLPTNTHLQFSAVQTMLDSGQARNDAWVSNNFYTYVRLQDGFDPDELIAKFPTMFETYAGPQIAQSFGMSYQEFLASGNSFGYTMQAVEDIHLKSNFDVDVQAPGSMNYVILFSAVALFILVLACINFMNLATARGATRAREVAIRKTAGSSRSQLIAQFLSEAGLLTSLSFAGAIGLVLMVLPFFNDITGLELGIGSLLGTEVVVSLILGAIVVSLVAGLYPAFYLSSFEPITVLKAETLSGSTKSSLRNFLVVFQFSISIVLLIGTFVVKNQLDFIQNKELGFDREHILVINRASALRAQTDAFKEKLRQNSNIIAVGASSNLPGQIHGGDGYIPEGFSVEDVVLFSPLFVDNDFVEAMGITMAEGRDFSADFPGDSSSVVINRAALNKIGWESGVGKFVSQFTDKVGPDGGPVYDQRQIVGVIEDYHFMSLRSEIGGEVFRLADTQLNNLIVRVTGAEMESTMAFIRETWDTFLPGTPVTVTFLNDDFGKLFESDQRLAQLFTGFSILAVIIASLGLFGLGFFMTEQRTKEIGIRKALGASFSEIILLLSKDFIKLVLVSFVIAVPIAYFGMSAWLDDFVYRTNIGVTAFLLAGGLALAIAWVTVSYQSIKAAKQNPISSLRHG